MPNPKWEHRDATRRLSPDEWDNAEYGSDSSVDNGRYWKGLFYGLLFELTEAYKQQVLPDAIKVILARQLPDHPDACGCCIYNILGADPDHVYWFEPLPTDKEGSNV